MNHKLLLTLATLSVFAISPLHAQWVKTYEQDFEELPTDQVTGGGELANWEAGSASGKVIEIDEGHILAAASFWTAFNRGPICNLDLTSLPHDKVRVTFDLITFGDWRGMQAETGGPQHRLMFFDTKADPSFQFDTNFSTNPQFPQSWPGRNSQRYPALTGSNPLMQKAEDSQARVWPIQFEYPSQSNQCRFAILCGAAAGSGKPMSEFAIDNFRIEVRSTARPQWKPFERVTQPVTTHIPITLKRPTRLSLAIYDASGRLVREIRRAEQFPAGEHRVIWDGLDQNGKPVPAGHYEWRMLETEGLTSRFVTTLGVNPPSGHTGLFSHNWVGDHLGAGAICVDESGLYLGAIMTEGGMQTLKQSHDAKTRFWEHPQYYDGGRLTRMAANGQHLFLIQPNGNLRKLDSRTGQLLNTWNLLVDKEAPADLDVHKDELVICYPEAALVRWVDPTTGKTLHEVHGVSQVRGVTIHEGTVSAITEQGILQFSRPNSTSRLVIPKSSHDLIALDIDHSTGELYLVDRSEGERIVRYDAMGKLLKTFGGQVRPYGKYLPTLFHEISDIAADGRGGFYITEPTAPPRRTAHFNAETGTLIDEWYGGQSFYVNIAADRDDPTSLWGCAAEGFLNHYRIDYDAETWEIEATYEIGRLADSLFPFTAKWKPFRRNGNTFLRCLNLPAMVRVDEEAGKIIPVSIAGFAHNGPRTFSMFPGSGENGFPRPFVAAARHHGFEDLNQVPRAYSWADANGNGQLDPEEFHFFPGVSEPRLGQQGVYDQDENYYKPHTSPGDSTAWSKISRIGWTGGENHIPVWSWGSHETVGYLSEEIADWPSIRALTLDDSENLYGAVQSGVMIREHGQYEGGRWPYQSLRRSRFVKWSPEGQEFFSVSRHSKTPTETRSGVLYYPMTISRGPLETIIIGDQVHQLGAIWTTDGLLVGSPFDQRANDGREENFYQTQSDDMQGIEIVILEDGRVFWMQSVQGMILVYEVTGWESLSRSSGSIRRPESVVASSGTGTGLKARYLQGLEGETALITNVEPILYYKPFGPDPHEKMPAAPHRIVWEGFLEAPLTDAYQFDALLGQDESLKVSVAAKTVFAAGEKDSIREVVPLKAGKRVPIKVEYINRSGRAELKLFWSSRILDLRAIDSQFLFAP